MIRIAMCDDETMFLQTYQKKVSELFQEHNVDCKIDTYTDARRFLEDCEKTSYDLIFLDIDMPEMSGMELAAEIRAMNSAAALIFVSSHSDFVFESFQFQPFRFLRKEWLAEELPDAVKAYCENYAKSGQTARLVLDDKRIVTKKLVEVVYFFSIRHHIYLVTLEETAELSAREYTLEKLEEQFSRSGFLRIHKSYLLNYRYVYHIGNDTVELTPHRLKKLPLSHRRSAAVRKRYQYFMRGEDDT